VARIQDLLRQAQREEVLLVYLDEAHIHQDADLGYGWSERGKRFWVTSSSPGLWAKASFYGLYLYNEGQVRIWAYERANGLHTVDVLRRLRREFPGRAIRVVWDGAGYHRARVVQAEAAALGIELEPLPGYSPDFMPVEALWHWLREEVTYHHCHTTRDELVTRVAAFEQRVNADPCALADRLWVKDHLDPEEEKLRLPR
jgi:transposase